VGFFNLNFEVHTPQIGKIYKKLYTKNNNNLNSNLSIQWGDYNFETILKGKEVKSTFDNNVPLFFDKPPYSNFVIKQTSHDDFYILYCWLPQKKWDDYDYFTHNSVHYIYKNGSIQKLENNNESSIIKFTLDKNPASTVNT